MLRAPLPCALPVALALLAAPLAAQVALQDWNGPTNDGRYGQALANAGDVDGDGVDDLIVGSRDAHDGRGCVDVWSGRTGNHIVGFIGGPGEAMGHAVAGVGDMNGDGRSEVAFSAPGTVQPAGPITVYDPVLIWDEAADTFAHIEWALADENQGWSLAGLGDADGNGLHELLVGVPEALVSGTLASAGKVLRMRLEPFGGGASVATVAEGNQAGQRMGWDVAWIGNVNGAPGDEFIVGSPFRDEIGFGVPGATDAGRVHVFDGHGVQQWTNKGPVVDGGRFGWSVAGGVDLSGNGLDEVIVGAPHYDGERGRVVVYHGHSGGYWGARIGDAAGDRLGHDVAGLVVDGEPHVLAGAPGDGENAGFTLFNPGVVHRLSGLALETTWSRKGGASYGELGWAVARLGDMNGDGSDEFAVGQPFPTIFQTDEDGCAWLYDGADHAAAWASIGSGLAGTNGVPALVPFDVPELGDTFQLLVGNSAGAPTPAVLFVGLVELALPFKGGTLHTDPLLTLSLPGLPVAGLQLPVEVPKDHTLSGLRLLMQSAQADAGAPVGVALSPGLELLYGP